MTKEPWVTVSDAIDDLPSLDAGDTSVVPDHLARNHRESTVTKYDGLSGGEVPHEGFSPRRLYAGQPSFTVTVSQGKTPIHHEEPRMTTVREVARLQSFPDTFTLSPDTRTDKTRLVGNAVPPDLAEAVVSELP